MIKEMNTKLLFVLFCFEKHNQDAYKRCKTKFD